MESENTTTVEFKATFDVESNVMESNRDIVL